MVRYKNRYFTVQISTKDKTDRAFNLQTKVLHEAIQKQISLMFGDYGSAVTKAGFTAKYCNAETRIALIKIRHGPHQLLLKALPNINDIDGKTVNIKVIYIGATMKQCFLFIKKYQRRKLESLWNKMKNDNDKKKIEEALMTMDPEMKDIL